jgi:hypothetical protein
VTLRILATITGVALLAAGLILNPRLAPLVVGAVLAGWGLLSDVDDSEVP